MAISEEVRRVNNEICDIIEECNLSLQDILSILVTITASICKLHNIPLPAMRTFWDEITQDISRESLETILENMKNGQNG